MANWDREGSASKVPGAGSRQHGGWRAVSVDPSVVLPSDRPLCAPRPHLLGLAVSRTDRPRFWSLG